MSAAAAHRAGEFETKSSSPKLVDMLPGLERALDRLDVTKLHGWTQIVKAFPGASFDGMTIYLSALVQLEVDKFAAPADVALKILSGSVGEFEESCPARVIFVMVQDEVVITDIEADLELSSEGET